MQYCNKCGNKTALVHGTYHFSADSEPYESGEELDIDLEEEESLQAQYCESCRSLSDVWCDDNPMTGARPNTNTPVDEIITLRERVKKLEKILLSVVKIQGKYFGEHDVHRALLKLSIEIESLIGKDNEN